MARPKTVEQIPTVEKPARTVRVFSLAWVDHSVRRVVGERHEAASCSAQLQDRVYAVGLGSLNVSISHAASEAAEAKMQCCFAMLVRIISSPNAGFDIPGVNVVRANTGIENGLRP